MLENMNSKQGAWVKPGNKNTDFSEREVEEGGKKVTKTGKAPGSYGDYLYVRAPPADYEKTEQQKTIGNAAKACAEKGKSLNEIQKCVAGKFEVAE